VGIQHLLPTTFASITVGGAPCPGLAPFPVGGDGTATLLCSGVPPSVTAVVHFPDVVILAGASSYTPTGASGPENPLGSTEAMQALLRGLARR
jgi:hypothetical protein